jgi:nicotinamide riboside transporter PnuC
MQIISFINWKRNSKDKFGTQFKKLPLKRLILLLVLLIPAWLCAYYGLSAFISGYFPMIDSLAFVLGLVVTVLSMLRFIEAPYINLVSCSINIVLWTLISIESPNNINFLFISIYNFIMVSESAVVWTKKYISQKKTAKMPIEGV